MIVSTGTTQIQLWEKEEVLINGKFNYDTTQTEKTIKRGYSI